MTLDSAPKPGSRPAGSHRNAAPQKKRLDSRQEELLAQRRREREQKNRRVILLGIGYVAAFLLVAAVAAFFWFRESARAEAEHQALLERRAQLRTELLGTDGLKPELAPALLARIEATRAEWEDGPDAAAIKQRAEQAKTVAADAAALAAFGGEIAALQRDLDAADKNPDTWQKLHERLAALSPRLPKGAHELHAQVETLGARTDEGWFEVLAAAGAAAGQDARAALALLLKAEDLGADRRDAAQKQPKEQKLWLDRLHKLAPALDAAEKAAFPEAAIAAVPWQDLQPKEADWVTSKSSELRRRADAEGLTLENPGSPQAHNAVVILRHDAWHACALAFDVQVDRGAVQLFGRSFAEVGDTGAGGVLLTTSESKRPDAVLVPAGKEVQVELRVVGDEVTAIVGTPTPQRIVLKITKGDRRGALAAVVRPDTALALRHLRVRRLS